MNGAEFKTLRESLGFKIRDVAKIARVTDRSVKEWESKANCVKRDVVNFMIELEQQYNQMINSAVAFSIEQKKENPQFVINLLRYRNDNDFALFVKNLEHVTAKSHASMLYKIKSKLAELNVTCNIFWMNKKEYFAWLGDRYDSEVLRAEWASLQQQ